MMKKRLLMLIPVALLMLCLLPTAVFAEVGETFTVQSSDVLGVTVTMKVLEMPEGSTPGEVQVGHGENTAVDTHITELTLPGIVKDSGGNEYTVTAVGNYAFSGCAVLKSVSFPQATTVGDYAFYNCTALYRVSLPKVTTIGDTAFSYCNALNSVSLPQATTIGDHTFDGCTSLNSVSLPKATTIGDEAFGSCSSLKSVTIWQMEAPSLGNDVFNGVHSDCTLYAPNISAYTAPGWPNAKVSLYAVSGTVYTADNVPIVGSTVTVGDTSTLSDDNGAYTVYVEKNKETTITAAKARLGKKSLKVTNTGTAMTGQDITFETFIVESSDVLGLEVVLKVLEKPQSVIPGKVQVGNGENTAVDVSATKVTLPGVVQDSEGNEFTVTAVGDNAFLNCTVLNSVSFPQATTVGDYAFLNCTVLNSVSFPQATTVGDYAFFQCQSIQVANLPKATSIGASAFYNCNALNSVNLPQVTTIEESAFTLCESLVSVSLPQVTTIEKNAFSSCSDLNSVSLPKATTIGDKAFGSCSSLKSVTIWQTKAPTLGANGFNRVHSECTLYVPNGAEGYTAANGWPSSIFDLYAVSGTVYTVDKEAVEGSTVTVGDTSTLSDDKGAYTVYVEKDKNTTITATKADLSKGSILVKNEGTALTGQDIIFGYFSVESSDEPSVAVTMKVLEMPKDSTPGKVQVGNGTEAAIATSITELTLPGIVEDSEGKEYTVTAVGEKAFSDCTALKSVSVPTATTIGEWAFGGCTSLKSVNFPQAIIIKKCAFFYRATLTELNLPKATTIENQAFSHCSALKSLYLPEATTIEDMAFEQCSSLISVSLPKATTIGGSAFFKCEALTHVSLPQVNEIENGAFNNCTDLTSVTIWQTKAPTLGTNGFYSVHSDCTLYVPNGADYTGTGWPSKKVPLYAVSGTVYNATKKPIVGSTVTVGDTSTLSDDKGAYTVYVEKDKKTTITATKADLSEWSIVVKSEGTALTGQDIIFDTAAMPQFSLESGAYIDTQSLTFSCATVGATIRFTTNGEEPTETKGAIYDEAAPFLITETTTIKAIAFKEGLTPSAVVTRDYVINPFTDISKDDWFSDDVMFVLQEGLMLGTDDTAFSPNAIATRGMIVTVLYRLAGEPEVSGPCPFTDVKPDIYYEDAMTWAASVGIVNGYGNGQCGPERFITREQLATMMYRYADYKKYDITAEAELSKYSDVNEISSYAETAMSWAVGSSLIQGKTDAALAPKDSALRSEVAAILHRFCVTFVE